MSHFKHHVFFCCNQREPGEPVAPRGAVEAQTHARDRIAQARPQGQGKIRINKAGCLDRCDEGPVLVVHPDNVWWHLHRQGRHRGNHPGAPGEWSRRRTAEDLMRAGREDPHRRPRRQDRDHRRAPAPRRASRWSATRTRCSAAPTATRSPIRWRVPSSPWATAPSARTSVASVKAKGRTTRAAARPKTCWP